jgi:5-methylthioadenosine/S-adenosylhomocysteine deaminase
VSLLVRDVLTTEGRTSLYVEGRRIAAMGGDAPREADTVIDGRFYAALPGFVNTHTHAAMTLLRSYADDMELGPWLSERIWPAEAKITPEDVYWGTKLACLEMIRSGTTAFNDMYFHMDQAAKAVEEMGLRAVLAEGFIDLGDAKAGEAEIEKTRRVTERIAATGSDRVRPAWGPHAIYTVSEGSLRALRALADETGWPIHMHLSETRREVEECVAKHGKRPVHYLGEMGLLGDDVLFAHGVWLERDEIRRLAEAGCTISHNPISNMKLAVGRVMPFANLRAAGVAVALGTDGCASNNNLDMFATMKAATLLQKHTARDPTVLPAPEALDLATRVGAEALGFDAGVLAPGKLADIVLLDLRHPQMTPLHDLAANVVYAATPACVDTVICDGRVLMRRGCVEGEDAILAKAASVGRDLVAREAAP